MCGCVCVCVQRWKRAAAATNNYLGLGIYCCCCMRQRELPCIRGSSVQWFGINARKVDGVSLAAVWRKNALGGLQEIVKRIGGLSEIEKRE